VVSPCAYVVGLLDRLVIDELELGRHGYRVTPADPNLWCPLPDGGSFASFIEPARTSAYLRDQGFADAEIEGLLAYERVFERCRLALRHGDTGDTWVARRRAARSSNEYSATRSWSRSCSRTRSRTSSTATSASACGTRSSPRH
jgi:hypothetical protein